MTEHFSKHGTFDRNAVMSPQPVKRPGSRTRIKRRLQNRKDRLDTAIEQSGADKSTAETHGFTSCIIVDG